MYNFDLVPDRAESDSVKWHAVSEGQIPMWVADMDFQSAPEIREAVSKRVEHGYFGYPYTMDAIKDLIVKHYEKVYQAKVEPEWIVWVPSVISGVVSSLQMIGGAFMYSVPMYDHIRRLEAEAKLPAIEVPLKCDENHHFTMDIEALEAALTPEVKCLILCNPHNPIGRVYTREELTALQQFCTKHGLLVISDEIHCELDLEARHIPFFSLNEEAAAYSITASSAGKICNIPGLPMGFVIIPNEELRAKLNARQDGLLACGNVLTLAAYEKAYDGSCDEWKAELREYLKGNRDMIEEFFAKIPEIKIPHNEGTYLLWVDCTDMHLDNPSEFFLEKANVKFSDGKNYGNPNFFRFNFGCPRSQLAEVLSRMEKAIEEWRNN